MDADTFAVTDQDGPVTTFSYSVTGDDREVFTFVNGVLTFKDHEPNFEEQSSYSITITARSGGRSASLDVTIEVVDTEDPGEVALSQRQPQVGREVYAAILNDPDGGVRIDRWTWAVSDEAPTGACADHTGEYTSVSPDVSSSTYTPQTADVGKCLRATVIYTDNIEGPGDPPHRVTGVSEAPVQDRRPANAAPRFVDQDLNSPGDQSDRTSRRVPENTDAGVGIGTEVSAMDEDDELLIYTLDGADASFFSISRTTGQLMTKASLNFEARNSYSVVVTATDPSGASDSIQVTVNVTNVHDPVFITGPTRISYAENGTDPVASYTAFDEAGHVIRWSLRGDDDDAFTIDDGVLNFREPPNYEDPQSEADDDLLPSVRNRYRVTVEAAGGTRTVTVTVTDVDEAGVASIDRPQPQVDRLLSAVLEDEDDMVEDETWQWARSENGRTWTAIEGATEPQRRPASSDVDMYLRATVTYSDRFGAGKTASAVTLNPVEATTLFDAAPSFAGQDEDESTRYIDVARSVDEHTAVGMPIGEPVSATDADRDILFYELLDTPDLEDGDGRARFTIDSLTGQIRVGKVLGADDPDETDGDPGEREDEDSTALDGLPALPGDEEADNAGNSEYVLRVRASDPSTASAVVNVIVRITEVNEPPAFPYAAPTLLTVVENEDPPVITVGHGGDPINEPPAYAVTDPDGSADGPDPAAYTYSVSGADGDDFDIDDGILTFKEGHEPDFEDQSSYSITIVARSGGEGRELSAAPGCSHRRGRRGRPRSGGPVPKAAGGGNRHPCRGQRRRRRSDHQEMGVGMVRRGLGCRKRQPVPGRSRDSLDRDTRSGICCLHPETG